MVRKERVGIPRPKSEFLAAVCIRCGTENVYYSNSARDVKCKQCGAVLALKTGGRVEPTENLGQEIRRLDNL